MMTNVAIIDISAKVLLEILDFEGGEVVGIRFPVEYYKGQIIELVLEHPDLPEVREGDQLTHIIPAYKGTQRERKRVDPPKKGK